MDKEQRQRLWEFRAELRVDTYKEWRKQFASGSTNMDFRTWESCRLASKQLRPGSPTEP
jgi:hypothetical protein